jgi:hypothetical protein
LKPLLEQAIHSSLLKQRDKFIAQKTLFTKYLAYPGIAGKLANVFYSNLVEKRQNLMYKLEKWKVLRKYSNIIGPHVGIKVRKYTRLLSYTNSKIKAIISHCILWRMKKLKTLSPEITENDFSLLVEECNRDYILINELSIFHISYYPILEAFNVLKKNIFEVCDEKTDIQWIAPENPHFSIMLITVYDLLKLEASMLNEFLRSPLTRELEYLRNRVIKMLNLRDFYWSNVIIKSVLETLSKTPVHTVPQVYGAIEESILNCIESCNSI